MKTTLPPNQHKVARVEQGHPYNFNGYKVIALSSGKHALFLMANEDKPWLMEYIALFAHELTNLPLQYLHGAVSPIDIANKHINLPFYEPCCDNEQRGWGGGCKTCGAPGF